MSAADTDVAAHKLEIYVHEAAHGEAAKQVLGDDYVPYVRATGLANRSTMKIWYDALDTAWQQHDKLEDRAMTAVAMVAAGRN